MIEASSLTPRFDPALLALADDPYPIYQELRAAGRIIRAGPGQIAVAQYPDVSTLLRSSRLSNQFPEEYRNFSVGQGPASDFLNRILLHRDPPVHGNLRRILGAPLARNHLPLLSQRIGCIVDSLLDRAFCSASFDAVPALAMPLPIMVICEILGVPAAEAHEIRESATALSLAFKLKATAEERVRVDRAVTFLRDYLRRHVLEVSQAQPASLLMSAARDAYHAGADLADIVDNLVFLFFAGFETTASLITTGSAVLAMQPAVFGQLREDPALIGNFVDEALRFDAPIQSRARLVTEPVVIAGRTIRAGRVILLLIGAANRDPQAFHAPDRFDLERRSPPHLSFGAGPHYCLGAQLAQIEALALFSALVRRCRVLALESAPVRDMSSVFRCYRSVVLRAVR
jgi:cytochrome P450